MDQTRLQAHLTAVVLGALAGAALSAVVGGVRQDPLTGWLVGGAVAGAVVGALVAPWWWKRRATGLDPYVAALPEAERGRFYREVRRGPVPADPDRRAAAIRVMRRRRDAVGNRSGLALLIILVWPIYAVYFAFRGDWFLVVVAALNIAATVDRWRAPGRAERRLTVLRAYPDPVDPGGRSQSG